MSKAKKTTIEVQGAAITVLSQKEQDFICLTDIARFKNPERSDDLVRNWLRTRDTVEFLGVWERLNNPDFNPVEFDGIKFQAGLNSFTLTPKQWIEKTRAVGIVSSAGQVEFLQLLARDGGVARRQSSDERKNVGGRPTCPCISRYSATPRR
ncbi:MAG: KilA-N domain-containing protein [Verrucomicrobia bacterium]|nr:KilA-N domain-containing protein [Verrucomicrobiota bacterium]